MTLLILGHLQLSATAFENGLTGLLNHPQFQSAASNFGATVLVNQNLPTARQHLPQRLQSKCWPGAKWSFIGSG
ncbi:hypothetical protein IV102_19340 [bacterium]|nr:hypothetical protein [bacterium]